MLLSSSQLLQATRTRRATRTASRAAVRAPPAVVDAPVEWAEDDDDAASWAAAADEAEAALAAERLHARSLAVPSEKERVFLVGIEVGSQKHATTLPIEASLDELAALADTAGLQVVGRAVQRLRAPDRRFFLGSGKAEEVLAHARALNADTLVFDDELSPSQGRNIERLAGETSGGAAPVRVCDRTALILDVFSQRAATREGVLQTKLAQLAYQTPRLNRMWSHLDRVGGGGLATKGAGEAQLEIDKRLLKEQAARLREKLEAVRTHRALHRRSRAGTPVLALCGYTSAGKSTLLNTLCGCGVLAEAALFSTLDPTTRRAATPQGQEVLISDTVGFIQKLPTQLVAAFRATLEEVAEASVLLHVVDAASPQRDVQAAAVLSVLKQLDVSHIPVLTVWNKVDALPADAAAALRAAARTAPSPTVVVSARTREGLDELWASVAALTEQSLVTFAALLPFDSVAELTEIRRHGALLKEEYTEEGVRIEARAPVGVAQRLAAFRTT